MSIGDATQYLLRLELDVANTSLNSYNKAQVKCSFYGTEDRFGRIKFLELLTLIDQLSPLALGF